MTDLLTLDTARRFLPVGTPVHYFPIVGGSGAVRGIVTDEPFDRAGQIRVRVSCSAEPVSVSNLLPATVKVTRTARQIEAFEWCGESFGWQHAQSVEQRGVRFLEEAVELAQAAGVDQAMAEELVGYVFGRPVGDLSQEFGGVGLTLLAFAEAAHVNADDAEAAELARVKSFPRSHWTRRNKAKNDAGFNVTGRKE